nr:universal stress protein [Candidatus Sigynarchaeota archaeon]
MFNKILVAFDGSDHATWALNKAIELARKFNSHVTVYHAIKHNFRTGTVQLPFIPFLGRTQDPLALDVETERLVYESYKNLAQRILTEAAKKLEHAGVGHKVELVENSDPVDAAKELVDQLGIDLVIIGARGIHGTLERVFLGSVSSGIVNNEIRVRSECNA